jgi:hypothetical protein
MDGGSIITGIKRSPMSVDDVRIYRVVPESYEKIAIVSVSAGHDFKSKSALIDSVIQRLKEEAASMAHGLAMEGIDNGNTAVSLLLLANLTSCSGLLSPKIIVREKRNRTRPPAI